MSERNASSKLSGPSSCWLEGNILSWSTSNLDPEDFVNPDKQKQMALAADEYIHLMSHQHEIRFDIISVCFSRNSKILSKSSTTKPLC